VADAGSGGVAPARRQVQPRLEQLAEQGVGRVRAPGGRCHGDQVHHRRVRLDHTRDKLGYQPALAHSGIAHDQSRDSAPFPCGQLGQRAQAGQLAIAPDVPAAPLPQGATAIVEGTRAQKLEHLQAFDAELAKSGNADVQAIRGALAAGAAAVGESVDYIVANAGKDVMAAFAGAVPFLRLMGVVAGGWQMARAALAAEKNLGAGDKAFLEAKLATARFYADQVLVQAPGLRDTVVKGASAVMAIPDDAMLAA